MASVREVGRRSCDVLISDNLKCNNGKETSQGQEDKHGTKIDEKSSNFHNIMGTG